MGNPSLPKVNPAVTESKTTGQAAVIPGNRMELAVTMVNSHRAGISSKPPHSLPPSLDRTHHPGTLLRDNPGFLMHHPRNLPARH